MRAINALLALGFALALIELCRQLATRQYSPFGIWEEPNPDATLYGGLALLCVLVMALGVVKRVQKNRS